MVGDIISERRARSSRNRRAASSRNDGRLRPESAARAQASGYVSSTGAALALGLRLQILDAGTENEIAGAFASIVAQGAGGLVVGADPFLTGRRHTIAGLSLRHAVPMIGSFREQGVPRPYGRGSKVLLEASAQ
jgi:hypothetical protein